MHIQLKLFYWEKSWNFYLLETEEPKHIICPVFTHPPVCQGNWLGGPEPFESWLITDPGHTGDLTPEKQLSTCWRHKQKGEMFRGIHKKYIKCHLVTCFTSKLPSEEWKIERDVWGCVCVHLTCFWLSLVFFQIDWLIFGTCSYLYGAWTTFTICHHYGIHRNYRGDREVWTPFFWGKTESSPSVAHIIVNI